MSFYDADKEKDAFWDLDALLPSRPSKNIKQFGAQVTPVDVDVVALDGNKPVYFPEEERRITVIPVTEDAEIYEYSPEENNLISTVRVIKRKGEYNFYGMFCRDAATYLHEEREACDYVSYFSYIPQYAQLSPEQLQYYFFWRSAVRRGEYIKTDESYFYLYVYEIINLPEFIPPKNGILLLCNVWSAYRKVLPRIDKYMAEWVADYCLVHELPCPAELLRPFLAKVLPYSGLKEFYLGAMGDYTPHGVDTALAFFSNYRWRESRYATGEQYAVFETHILGAMAPVLAYLFASEQNCLKEAARTIKKRDAFCGSLCAHNVRCKLEVTYYSLKDAEYLRSCITAAVKYAENKIRALLSVKSRLAVQLPKQNVGDIIDRYFSVVAHTIRTARAETALPEYEKLYDAPTLGVDLSRAEEIERLSWNTTMALVPEEEQNEIRKQERYIEAASKEIVPNVHEDSTVLCERERCYLKMLLCDDMGDIQMFLRTEGVLEDEIVERINDKSTRCIGDVVLENTGDSYAVIEDYVEEVLAWIEQTKQ